MADSYITVPADLSDEVSLKRFLSQVLDKTKEQSNKISDLTSKLDTLQNNYKELEKRVNKLENP